MKINSRLSKQRKKRPIIWLILATLIIVVLSVGGYFWYRNWQEEQLAIQRQEEVEELTEEFLNAYAQSDFDAFVERLTLESIEAEGYTQEELSERYATVYGGIGVENTIVTDYDLTFDEETDAYALAYSVDMETALGDLTDLHFETSVSESETSKLMNWNPTLLLPNMGEGDTVRLSYTQPKRGSIYDRHGNMLAGEGEAWEAGLYPSVLGEGEERIGRLETISEALGNTVESLETLLAQSWVGEESFVPIRIVEETPELPGVLYQRTIERVYPLREAAAHLVGYVGEVSAEDIENNPVLRQGQFIGKAGLESVFEEQLRGELGGEISIVDAAGEVKEQLIENEKQDGQSIHLTIDSGVQEALYQAFEEEPGTASMMDPGTGELLALASSPSYNPQLFARGISQEAYTSYLENENSPFLNRYTARYVPGSTFKILTAMTFLESGVTTPEKTNHIEGYQWSPETDAFGNHQITRVNSTVTDVDLETALIYSDNIFFAMEALEMGSEAFTSALKHFPFEESLGLPFDIPAAQFANDGEINRDTLLADTAYGQGEVLMNTIHQLAFYSPAINQGNLVYPKIMRDEEGEAEEEEALISQEVASFVENSLIESVTNPSGTAHGLNGLPYSVGAKTGTAEIAGEDGNETNGLLYVFDAEDYQYSFIGHLEGSRSGEVIHRFLPFLTSVKDNF